MGRVTVSLLGVATLLSAVTGLSLSPQVVSPQTSRRAQPHVSFPGGGLFFWWQAGYVAGLAPGTLDGATMSGCSAGSLTATLAASGVDFDKALDLALELSREAGVWDGRSLGLLGIWGDMVRTWLDELLPEDALERCGGRVDVLATPIPSAGWVVGRVLGRSDSSQLPRVRLSDFNTRDELIEACMSSVHIPIFMDWRPVATGWRDTPFIDGSFLSAPDHAELFDFRTGKAPDLVVDHKQDPEMATASFLELSPSPDTVRQMMDRGRTWARQQQERGEILLAVAEPSGI